MIFLTYKLFCCRCEEEEHGFNQSFYGSTQSFQCVLPFKTESQSWNCHLRSSLPCSLAMQNPRRPMIYLSHFMYTLTVSHIWCKEAIICAVADFLGAFPCLFPCIIQSFPEITAALYMQARRPLTRHTNVM